MSDQKEKNQSMEHVESSGEVKVHEPIGGGRFMQHELVKEANVKELQLFKCPNCGKTHFRHAGYVIPMLPYEDEGKPKVSVSSVPVYLCVSCKHSYVNIKEFFHDVTEQVNFDAWEKSEKVAAKAVGPGGGIC